MLLWLGRSPVTDELRLARDAIVQAKNHLTKAYDDLNHDGLGFAAHSAFGIQLVLIAQDDALLDLERRVMAGTRRRR